MEKLETNGDASDRNEATPLRVRLPRFIANEEIGLGDVIKRATYYVGVLPCGGCEGRAATLNRRVVFAPWRRR
jgi:hypothetical protein